MKISEYKGEDALDLLADIIDPAAEIFSDKAIARAFKKGGKMAILPTAKIAIKNHKKAVIQIMAILDGANPEEYAETINVFSLPAKLIEILNDPAMINFFTSQAQMVGESAFGTVTENTKGAGKK